MSIPISDQNFQHIIEIAVMSTALGEIGPWVESASEDPTEWAIQHIKISYQLENAIKQMQLVGKNEAELQQAKQVLQRCKLLDKQLIAIYGQKILQMRGMTYVDKNRLISSLSNAPQPLHPSVAKWHEHLGLLINVYLNTTDPKFKKQIAFLTANYLAKATPISFPFPNETNETRFQRGLFQQVFYHRADWRGSEILYFHIKSKMTENMPIILLDTPKIENILPLRFHMVPTHTMEITDWTSSLVSRIERHVREGQGKFDLTHNLVPPILFDFTTIMEKHMFSKQEAGEKDAFNLDSAVEDDKSRFKAQLYVLEEKVNQAVIATVEKLKKDHPEICKGENDEKRLLAYLRANIGCICRSEINNVGVLASLPIFNEANFFFCSNDPPILGIKNQSPDEFSRALELKHRDYLSSQIEAFVDCTGTRIGAVKYREALFDFVSLNDVLKSHDFGPGPYQFVEYANKGPNAIYYSNREKITQSRIFHRLALKFSESNPNRTYLNILGKPTLDLVKELLNKISTEKWHELNDNEEIRQLFQQSLYRIMIHLSNAERKSENFTEFVEQIEMIHCEIVDLLTIVRPYKEGEFENIYRARIMANVPEELRNNIHIGLSRSAMNTFAGINVAVMDTNPTPERTHGELVYTEEVFVLGRNREVQDVLANPDIEKVDLYVGEFNHNVTNRQEHNRYTAGNVFDEVNKLLIFKPKTEHLTVAIDCTIDYLHSPKVKELLTKFSPEIKSGKLNFVFFRSGQKFDMMGMDNYYGSPFYVVNNGADHWSAFNRLNRDRSFQTDDLSHQWFCLMNSETTSQATDNYLSIIAANTRQVLNRVPESLQPGTNPTVKVCQVDDQMLPTFIDIKVTGPKPDKICHDIQSMLIKKFQDNKLKIHERGSFGFFHPNFTFIPAPDGQTKSIRINPGIDPAEVKILVEFLQEVAQKYAQPI